MEERGRAHREHDDVARPFDLHLVHLLDGRIRLAAGCAEAGKVVRADQVRGRFPHAFDVERAEHPAGASGQQRGRVGVVVQHVVIGARTGREAGVEVLAFGVRRDHVRPAHDDRLGQERVRAAHPRLRGAVEVRVEMDDLLDGVDAGVGAAGARRRERRAGKFLERDLQLVLDRVARWLFLIPVPGGAHVLDTQCDTCQIVLPYTSVARIELARAACSGLPPRMTSSSSSRAPSLSPISW